MAEVNGQHILFSGCASARRTGPPLPPFAATGAPARQSTIALARELHVDMWESPHAGCCGARADLRVTEEGRRTALAPLVDGAERGMGVVCLSPACARVVGGFVHGAPGASDGAAVRDVVGLLTVASTLRRVADARNPLGGLRVALHSTCHADHNVTVAPALPSGGEAAPRRGGMSALLGRAPWLRPRQAAEAVTRAHEPADATYVAALSRLVTAIGADAVGDVSRAGRCASNGLLVGSLSRFLGGRGSAPCLAVAARGADVVVTPCFLCFMGLNTYQQSLPRGDPARGVPVLHIAQLVGLACGIAPQRLLLGRTTVSARRILLPFIA